MMDDSVYTKFYIHVVSTLTVVEATLSVIKMKIMVGNVYITSSAMSTLTVEVEKLSVNR